MVSCFFSFEQPWTSGVTGDAYMVVSGIPIENGIRHLMHLSDVALEMMVFLDEFRVPHKKNDKIRIRLGLHTGLLPHFLNL